MSIVSGKVSKVSIGVLEFDGLLLEDGRVAVAFSQLSELNLVPPNRSAKQLESLTGINFTSLLIKIKTPMNPKPTNALPI